MPRSLSSLESQLILRLEWEKKQVVNIQETAQILDISPDYARLVLHRLASDGWLKAILPGKYELIPAERGEYAFPDTNPFFIGSHIVSPYYFSFATAAFHLGLTTQASQTVYIATKGGKTMQRLVREKTYQLVNLPEKKFFGFKETDAYGQNVWMAGVEKTILDSLDKPKYAGDIPEITTMLWRGRNRIDWEELVSQSMRFRSRSLHQRLGYLVSLLNLEMPASILNDLAAQVSSNTCYLGSLSRWGRGGEYDPDWQVVANIPRQHLLADIEII
jgi:predicted transcriptional regulator of viral defense system